MAFWWGSCRCAGTLCWSPVVPHSTRHSAGLATRALGDLCPKLLRPGLTSSAIDGNSEKLHQKSTTTPSAEGAGHGDAELCSCSPGGVLSELKLAVQWATHSSFLKGERWPFTWVNGRSSQDSCFSRLFPLLTLGLEPMTFRAHISV